MGKEARNPTHHLVGSLRPRGGAHRGRAPKVFAGAVAVIAVWAISGRLFDLSDTWELVINTGTSIVTFLMVFLIQNTQNRDSSRFTRRWTR